MSAVFGDVNARLHARLPDENTFMGPHVFGKGVEYARDSVPGSNRDHMVEFCTSLGFCIADIFNTPKLMHRITFGEVWS